MNKKVFKIVFVFVLAIIFAGAGYFLVHYGKQNKSVNSVYLREKGNVDYEVCLKKNEFISSECLTKDSEEDTYIASLIDYLNLKYSYNIAFDSNFSGTYTYYYKAVIKGDTDDESNGNFFTKEFVLSDKVTKEFNNVNSFDINDSIKIDYNKYNDLLKSFRDTYGLSLDGKLVVSLEANILYTNDSLGRKISRDVTIPVVIPLTSKVIEIPITSSSIDNKREIYSTKITDFSNSYFISKAAGYTSFVLSGMFILLLVKLGAKYAKIVSEYKRELKKIMRMYDSIIVNVSKAPKLGSGVIYVASFSELIDAHSEVRKPINFVESNSGALFYLMSDGNTWAYKLDKKDDED